MLKISFNYCFRSKENPTRPEELQGKAHLYNTWLVTAQCCTLQGTKYFPCDAIPDDATTDAEQAFSTACE